MSEQQPLTPEEAAAYQKMNKALKFEGAVLKGVLVFVVLGLVLAVAVGIWVATLL